MATVIELGDGSFVAGDPPEGLDIGQHWCDWCGGSGLSYGDDAELEMCPGCYGQCVRECGDTACEVHSALHPQR